MEIDRALMTAIFSTLEDSWRNARIVNNMCYAKTGNQPSMIALVGRSGVSMTIPEDVSTDRHTAIRVEVSTTSIICSLLLVRCSAYIFPAL